MSIISPQEIMLVLLAAIVIVAYHPGLETCLVSPSLHRPEKPGLVLMQVVAQFVGPFER